MSDERSGDLSLTESSRGDAIVHWPTTASAAFVVGFVAYYLAATVSLLIARQNAELAMMWFANPVGALVLLRAPWRQWPYVVLGLVLANVCADYPFSDDLVASLAFPPANLLEMVLGASLMRRFVDIERTLVSAGAMLAALCLGALLPAAAGAFVGGLTLSSLHGLPYPSTWMAWFESGLFGGVFLLPFGLCVVRFGVRDVLARIIAPGAALRSAVMLALAVVTMRHLPNSYAWLGALLMLCMLCTPIVSGLYQVLLVALVAGAVLVPEVATQGPIGTPGRGMHAHVFLPLVPALLPAIALAVVLNGLRRSVATLEEERVLASDRYRRSPALLHTIDGDGLLVGVSDLWLERLGYRRDEVIGRRSTDFLTPESRRHALDVGIPETLRTGGCRDLPYRLVRRDGAIIDVALSAIVDRDAHGKLVQVHGYLDDVTEETRLRFALEAEHELLEVTLRCIGDGVLTTDRHGAVSYANPEAEAMIGSSLDELVGRPFADVVELIDGRSGEPIDDPIAACLARRGVPKLPPDTVLRDRLGAEVAVENSVAPIFARDGALRGAVMVFQDVTESRLLNERMAFLAHHDTLTGLANRFSLQAVLEATCVRAGREAERFALVFIDLDHFKHVNDSLGHDKGDILLETVARRLERCLRPQDLVARLGGDEFVLLLDRLDDVSEVEAVAREVLERVARPIAIDGIDIGIGVSMGAAMFPDDGVRADELMKRADVAMYRSKRLGRNRCHFFATALDAAASERLQLETDLRLAVVDDAAGGRIVVHYQPIVDGTSHLANGVEALVRWHHPIQGLLSPDAFVPMAEESGLIVDLGRRVLEIACDELARLERERGRPLYLSVNVSALQLSGGFVEDVRRVLEARGMAGEKLLLEITESALMDDPEQSLEIILALKTLGVRIAVDDFGTGYSSLSHLRRFPVDVLKIDRSFVREICTSDISRAFIDAFVALSVRLEVTVVAEGVETIEQARQLAALGCTRLQGFLFSRPVPLGAASVPPAGGSPSPTSRGLVSEV